MFANILNSLVNLANYISTKCSWLGKKINTFAVNISVNRARHRPHPWSTAHDYISWISLTDKHWSARHLPAKQLTPPKSDIVVDLFRRPQGQQRLCPKSTCLFPAFAQYLTDGFIRTRMPNRSAGELDDPMRKQNTSNHDIDLSPLYGRTKEQTDSLRVKSNDTGKKGRLKSQIIKNMEEYAPFLFENGSIKKEFEALDRPLMLDKLQNDPKIVKNLFAFGGDRANASPQIAMMNTLFLREHNRLASEIEKENPDWDDDRIFETVRNTNIVLFIKVVVEEYINHISSGFKFHTDPSVAWNAPWNKPNWITTEFSLLYRWHSLIPDTMKWGKSDYPVAATIMNNSLFLDIGLKQSFIDMSTQQAGQIGAFNTADALIDFEKSAIDQGRLCKLASYSDYCAYVSSWNLVLPNSFKNSNCSWYKSLCDWSRPKDFSDISKKPKVVELLRNAYEKVDDVEFYVGLFAEDVGTNTPLPSLLSNMVALDAFSQALTNPLLSEHVWPMGDKAFSAAGWDAIAKTKNLRDIVERNVAELNASDFIGMTRQNWQPA
jgi:prostaglandin-endoperoxide synthase 2